MSGGMAMIRGIVSEDREAIISIAICGPAGSFISADAIIDTGFNGYLTLPLEVLNKQNAPKVGQMRFVLADGSESLSDLYELEIIWDGRSQLVEIDAAESVPLVGMALLDGFILTVDAVIGGGVTVASRHPIEPRT